MPRQAPNSTRGSRMDVVTEHSEDDPAGKAEKPPSTTKQLWMLSALMFSMMLCGWVEGSIGPLLPSLQEFYKTNYEKMSYIFIAGFIGALTSGCITFYLTDLFGFGVTILLGALAVAIAYGLSSIRGSFGLFLFSYGLNGFGGAVQDAQGNNFASRLPAVPSGVFQVQACFSLGATIAPFISTLVVERFIGRPHLFFLIAMAVSLANAAILGVAFRCKTQKQLLGAASADGPVDEAHAAERSLGGETEPLLPRKHNGETRGGSEKLRTILTSPTVWAVSGWVFFYCGAEVAITEFLTSYLITERNGTVSAGYANMGFWAAMTFSRFLFSPLSRKMGWYYSIYVYSVISLAAQVVGLLTPSLVGCSIAYAVVGLVYGPLYPNIVMYVAEELDEELRVGIIALMGTVSGLGSAILPTAFGAIFDRFGIWSFVPATALMIVASLLCWILAPNSTRR